MSTQAVRFALVITSLLAACGGGDGSKSNTDLSDAGNGSLDAASHADATITNTCPALTGPGTVHGTGSLDSDNEVWTAAASPHIITFRLTVRSGKKLTIEPCAVVRLDDNMSIEINDAELVAEGTATQPILFERNEASAPWHELLISGDSTASLAYVTLDGGGARGNSNPSTVATLRISADPNDDVPLRQTLRVDHVAIQGSSSLGAFLDGVVGFTDDSRDLFISGGASAPLRAWQRGVGTIPTGSYNGNAEDQFLLERGGYGNDVINGEVTIHDRGLPYHVTSDLKVGRAATVNVSGTLTIEPGVTLRFDAQKTLNLAGTDGTASGDLALGSLHAVGTTTKPILFTSAAATPAAGDWGGIVFNGVATSATRIEYATVAYAGGGNGIASASCGDGTGSAGDEAAITITGWDAQPTAPFVQHTRIEHSPRFGIVSGWRGDAVDFVTTNEFVDVASCWVSAPRNRANGCPSTPVCPR